MNKQVIQDLLAKGILVQPDQLDGITNLNDLESDGPFLKTRNSFEVLTNYVETGKKRTFDQFVDHFNARYKALELMLKQRSELQSVTSVGRLKGKKDRETVGVIGMIHEKSFTKNNNIMLKVEDQTGMINVLISQKNPELFEQGKDIVLDEVVGITGVTGENIVFANGIYHPDVPLTKELKKSPVEEYVCFVGDPHVGQKNFLKEEFEKFLHWLQGNSGSDEQKRIAKLTKYVIFTGDLVEGVGVYPGQEVDLHIKDLEHQYQELARYLDQIPHDKHVVICPGNHDAVRLAEPQPSIYKEFAQSLYDLPHVQLVSSPSTLRIGAKEGFPGFEVLLYHGFSLIYYSDNVPSIRAAGGQKRADLILKFLLQRRHLAPTHGSNQYVPQSDKDPLVISSVPDFIVTGHIHRVSVSNYRNVTLINAGCWNSVTEDQESRGLSPQPGKLPLVNLQNRRIKIINFVGAEKTSTGRMQEDVQRQEEERARKKAEAKAAAQSVGGDEEL